MIKKLIIAILSFRIVYSSVFTGLQYFTWQNNEFSKLFLPPYQSISYFIKYSFTHFWLGMILGVALAFLFYFILKTTRKTNHLEAPLPSDSKVGLLGALIVSWPNFIVFVAVALISAVLFSAYRGIIYKKTDISLFWPFIVAAIITLIFGNYLISFFHLAVLRI